MSLTAPSFRITVSVFCSVALIAGCATPPGTDGSRPTGESDNPCSLSTAAILGGVTGAVIGGLLNGGKGAAAGAIAGAATGYLACLAYSVKTTQQKTAQQVEVDYRKQHKGQLPPTPKVTEYKAAVTRPAVQRGTPFALDSTVEVVNGKTEPVQSVREELMLYAPDGKAITQDPKSKPFTATSAGRYSNTFNLKFPPGAPQGDYGIKTKLYVNEKHVASRDLQAKVVWTDGQPQVVQVASR